MEDLSIGLSIILTLYTLILTTLKQQANLVATLYLKSRAVGEQGFQRTMF